MKCEGIIFDLDGVIADTETYFLTAIQQAASENGFVVTEEEFIHHTILKGESVFEAHPDIAPEKTGSIRQRRDQLYMQFLSERLIEDSEKGVKAGKDAGCRVIALSRGRYSRFQNYSLADSIVSSMAEAQRLLMADI